MKPAGFFICIILMLSFVPLASCGPGSGNDQDSTLPRYGRGLDGPAVFDSGPSQVNTVTASVAGSAGSRVLEIISGWDGFSVGRAVLIAQTACHLPLIYQGCWEENVIAAIGHSPVSGTTFTLMSPMENDYLSDPTGNRAQAVLLPEYTDATIAAGATLSSQPWDGTTGGILAFKATGSIVVKAGGEVTMSGLGYPGGVSQTVAESTGYKGYGHHGEFGLTSGSGYLSDDSGGGAGRGEPVCRDGGGGGGGGHGTSGQDGQDSWCQGGEAGSPVGGDPDDAFFMGGGGGSGGTGYYGTSSGAGGNGGGVVYLSAPTVIVEGTVRADGEDGLEGISHSAGGGGAGGTILIRSRSSDLGNNRVTAMGGAGGPSSCCMSGGQGGEGIIHVDTASLTGTTDPSIL